MREKKTWVTVTIGSRTTKKVKVNIKLHLCLLLYCSLSFFLAITKAHFKFHCVVGKGGFGRVWKIERKKFKSMYAMKEMSKVRIVNKKSVNSVINERKLLA